MVDVTDTADYDGAQFDFAGNQGEPSPFAFVPSSATSRCGVSQSGNQARIEVIGCQKPILLTFITGFVHEFTSTTATFNFASFPLLDQTLVVPDQSPDYLSLVTPLQTLSSSPEYIYQSSPSDTIVGPTIMFEQGAVGTS